MGRRKTLAESAAVPGRRMTGRGVAALLSGVGLAIAANVLSAPILLYLAVLLFALLVLSAIAVFAPRRRAVVGRTVTADLLTVGDDTTVRLRLDLRTMMRAPAGAWHDVLPRAVRGGSSGDFPSADAERTSNGVTMTMTYPISGARRGLASLGPLMLRTEDPFGLFARAEELGEVTPITVVPAILPLPRLTDKTGRAGGTAQTSSHRLGQGSDNLSPRRYVPGDSMRRIHWRATAHRGDLMVRQEEQESSPDALVVLDRAGARWPSTAEAADPEAFDHAVTACAAVAVHLVDHGYAVDVVDATGVLIGRLRGAEDERDGLLVALAAVSPRSGERDAGLPAASEGHTIGPLVVITGSIDEVDAAALPHGGAGTPILLATAPAPDALTAAAAHGWHTAVLGEDPALAWADAGAQEEPAHVSV
ncbi:DUF58 domain-containing protein [Microbacterium sp. ASV81]|uniref:DUF58 domain-containing protein n=1 Tax=Microbacterium capsulatum TaxID=3041921 RepID=A0ABU0XGV6_9MICO|nr:DUF58 domain-containing protein [Microbacterium sp. ASV81]MDQ4214363.1 DUF58 domain-containing protein [Microbacterium sp. ASV81]